MAPPSPLTEGESSGADDISLTDSSHSLALAMAKSAPLMKEEDATFLERGVRNSCSSGQTPILAPMSDPVDSSLIECLPPLSASSETPVLLEDRYGSLQEQFILEHEEFSNRHVVARLNPCCESDEVDQPDDETQQKESAHASEDMRSKYRRCLSGDVRPRSRALDQETELTVSGDDIISVSPVSVAEAVRPSKVINEIEPLPSKEPDSTSGLKVRSKSFDRRLNEAMQFAEAVGEMSPLDQNYVQVIIEETGSDDDEDSDVEIHVDDKLISSHESVCHPESNADSLFAVRTNDASVDAIHTKEASLATPAMHIRQKSRPRWPLPSSPSPSLSFMHKLPAGVNTENYVYKGICSNPPEITTHGISRGNYAQLHRKAWLEVSDKYHRYGKNLRLYYKRWESLGFPTNQFFDWLDSKGEAAGQPLPNLEECPRSQLDADTVHYISNPAVTQGYAISIITDEQGRGKVVDVDGDPVVTGPEGWIFVLRDHTLYGAEKVASISGHSKQRFHHSSFFGGKAVAAAGIIITEDHGILTRLYPHSGHYRPGEADMQRMLFYLHDSGVDLSTFEMDTQQILHVTRHEPPGQHSNEEGEKKKKKIQSLHLKKAVYVACFLAHKARFIGEGVFDQIHTIRKADVTSVIEALRACDNGGFWAKRRCELQKEKPG